MFLAKRHARATALRVRIIHDQLRQPRFGHANTSIRCEEYRQRGTQPLLLGRFPAPNTISSFEKLTWVKVRVSYFDSHEMQEARILAGHSGFDVVDPSAPYFQRQIRSGAYPPLDKKKLPNLANQDPTIMARVAVYHPGNVHGVVYTWGTYGIIYNEKTVAAALPNVPVNSWRLIFDPAYAEKLAKCGSAPSTARQASCG